AAAVRLVVREGEQAGLAEGAEDLPREAAGGLVLRRARLQLALDQVPGEAQQLAGLLAGQLALHGFHRGRGHGGGRLRERAPDRRVGWAGAGVAGRPDRHRVAVNGRSQAWQRVCPKRALPSRPAQMNWPQWWATAP